MILAQLIVQYSYDIGSLTLEKFGEAAFATFISFVCFASLVNYATQNMYINTELKQGTHESELASNKTISGH